jgi:hypothetical protein
MVPINNRLTVVFISPLLFVLKVRYEFFQVRNALGDELILVLMVLVMIRLDGQHALIAAVSQRPDDARNVDQARADGYGRS